MSTNVLTFSMPQRLMAEMRVAIYAGDVKEITRLYFEMWPSEKPEHIDLAVSLRKEFEDKEYREAYLESFRNSLIATQLIGLRRLHGWTQEKLAAKTGMKQPSIARMEGVNYGKWSVGTLRRIANAYGMDLCIRFQSTDRAITEITKTPPLDGITAGAEDKRGE